MSLGSGDLGTAAALCARRVEKSADDDDNDDGGGGGGGGGKSYLSCCEDCAGCENCAGCGAGVTGMLRSPVLMSGGKSLSHSV